MLLMTEINEDVRIISEANDQGGKSWFIEGVFMQGNKENKNKNNKVNKIK